MIASDENRSFPSLPHDRFGFIVVNLMMYAKIIQNADYSLSYSNDYKYLR